MANLSVWNIIPEFTDHSSFSSRWGGLSAPLACPNRRHLRSLAHEDRIRKDLFENHQQRPDELAGIWRHDHGWFSHVALSSTTPGRWGLWCMDTARLPGRLPWRPGLWRNTFNCKIR